MTPRPNSPAPGRRLGPRPLPLHLTMAAVPWLASSAALPGLSDGSIAWNGSALRRRGDRLSEDAKTYTDAELRAAVDRAACERLGAFVDGILRYRRHPFVRTVPAAPVIWSEGAMRVHGFGPADGPPAVIVPSMINRSYVLDIAERRSLVRTLAACGHRVALVEWGRPGLAEAGMTLADAVARLGRAIDAVAAGRRPVLVGYCMGGLLALAAALPRRDRLRGAAFLATPWDFHADGRAKAQATAAWMELVVEQVAPLGEVPVDLLQVLFTAADPFLALKKFTAFAGMDPDSDEARGFVALEDWLNDGVPLPAAIARECARAWYGENRPARGEWAVDGTAARAETLDIPTLVFVPERDRIVPPNSARALGAALPVARMVTVPAGHIGMVVGHRAKEGLYRPIAAWMDGLG